MYEFHDFFLCFINFVLYSEFALQQEKPVEGTVTRTSEKAMKVTKAQQQVCILNAHFQAQLCAIHYSFNGFNVKVRLVSFPKVQVQWKWSP
jgi:hypothetical protein